MIFRLPYSEPPETRIAGKYSRSPKALVVFSDGKSFLTRRKTIFLNVYEARSYFNVRHTTPLESFPSYPLGTYQDSLVIVFLCPLEYAIPIPPVYDIASIYTYETECATEFGLLGRATALLRFHRDFRFCPVCGCKLSHVVAPASLDYEQKALGITFTDRCIIAKKCLACKRVHKSPYYPSVIGIVVAGDKALCYQRRGNLYTHVAGFVDPGETATIAMVREVREEMGVLLEPRNCKLMQLTQPWPTSPSLMLVFHCLASEDGTVPPLTFEDCEANDGFWADKDRYLSAIRDEEKSAEKRAWVIPDKKSVARWMYDLFFLGCPG